MKVSLDLLGEEVHSSAEVDSALAGYVPASTRSRHTSIEECRSN